MTDIPVNHLNSRLALQLPAELPLGLVFVVGCVENLLQSSGDNHNNHTKFELVEKNHRIQCELSRRAAEESNLTEGTRVRAGGHLAFDSHRARYFLLARDVEQVSTPVIRPTELSGQKTSGKNIQHALGRQALTPILADIKRRAEATHLEEAQLPYWVKKLAPTEVKEELAQLEPTGTVTAVSSTPAPLDNKLLSLLSQAIDSEEEIELTPELLAGLAPIISISTTPHPIRNRLPQNQPSATAASASNLTLSVIVLVFTLILIAVLLTYLFTL